MSEENLVDVVKGMVKRTTDLTLENMALKRELKDARDTLQEVIDYAAFDPDNDEYPVTIARNYFANLINKE